MNIKRIAKTISKHNPIRNAKTYQMRKELINSDITFLTPNCIGGILFHDLRLKFMSPTINLMMTQKDFLQFVLYLDNYLNGSFEFFTHPEYTCPCARLTPRGEGHIITIHFTHYHSEAEAIQKWNERKKRINYNNIFIVIEERDGITKHDLEELKKLNVKGIVAFTCNEYPDLPYTVFIHQYNEFGEVGNILKQNHVTGQREYEKFFDFVKWFNEADGIPYDVENFKRDI